MHARRILVVEDFELFRKFVVSRLQQQQAEFEVAEASGGLEALQKAEECHPELVLLDVGLPDLNGIEVARRLRALSAAPKIVFVSQESSPEVVQEALDLGALGYVHKLRAQTDLLAAIEAALEGRRFVSSDLPMGGGTDTEPRHEILFCSDTAALLNALADFVGDALKSGNAALVRATKSHDDALRGELLARGVGIGAAIQRGTYAFWDVKEPPDRSRAVDLFRHLSEAASKLGTRRPRVAYWGELAGRMWSEGKIDEAIRLEQVANELAKQHDVDILCPYPSPPRGVGDQSAFKKVCAEHSVVSYR